MMLRIITSSLTVTSPVFGSTFASTGLPVLEAGESAGCNRGLGLHAQARARHQAARAHIAPTKVRRFISCLSFLLLCHMSSRRSPRVRGISAHVCKTSFPSCAPLPSSV